MSRACQARVSDQAKHNGKRAFRVAAEVVPAKAHQPRPARFRAKTVEVKGVAFEGCNRHGDYGWHLQPQQQDDPKYGRALHIYNENMTQQNDKASTGPGAGNACARPHRAHGRAIGMPTGHYGGVSSMDEWCDDLPPLPLELSMYDLSTV